MSSFDSLSVRDFGAALQIDAISDFLLFAHGHPKAPYVCLTIRDGLVHFTPLCAKCYANPKFDYVFLNPYYGRNKEE